MWLPNRLYKSPFPFTADKQAPERLSAPAGIPTHTNWCWSDRLQPGTLLRRTGTDPRLPPPLRQDIYTIHVSNNMLWSPVRLRPATPTQTNWYGATGFHLPFDIVSYLWDGVCPGKQLSSDDRIGGHLSCFVGIASQARDQAGMYMAKGETLQQCLSVVV